MQNKSCLLGRLDTKGFTLIELLVVVLIIGILAAVAVPQYRLAVAKSRYTEIMTIVDSLVKAQDVYFLANGSYAEHFDELAVDFAHGDVQTDGNGEYVKFRGYSIYVLRSGYSCAFAATSPGRPDYWVYLSSKQRTCTGRNELGDQVCKSFGGKYISTSCRVEGSTAHGCQNYNLP